MRTPDESPILVVEDNGDDALLIRRAFTKAKLLNPLLFVDNGEAAIEYLRGTGEYADRKAFPVPALMLLDLKLPRKSGFEVIEWVRASEAWRVLPVVVLTSSRESVDVQRAYSLGANTYLMKPVAFDDLMNMMKALGMYWFVVSERPVADRGR